MEGNVKKGFLMLLTVCWFFGVYGQQVQTDTVNKAPADTLILQETVKPKKPHSPHKATIMAMILPGSAQIYNGQWWKVPILYGGIGATIYGISWNSRQFKTYKSAFMEYAEYLDNKAKDPDYPYPEHPAWDKVYPLGGVEDFTPQQQSVFKTQLQNKKNSFKRNRDLLYIVMGGIYALQIIDACVFAHFYDFEINEDLSLHIQPTSLYNPASGGMVGLTLTFNF